MGGPTTDDDLDRLRRLEARTVRQERRLILLACACGCLALYVVNVIRPWDNVHADAVETGRLETTAIMFRDHESGDAGDPVAYLTTWPLAASELPAAPPEHRVFTPQLMLRDPGRPPAGGTSWTRRLAFDLTGDMPSLAFYDARGELKAVLTIRATGPIMELRDPEGNVVFSTDPDGLAAVRP